MALARIKKGDIVKIIAGRHKGKVATVNGFKGADGVFINGVGERKRHAAANRYMPAGKRDIQLPIHISNVALVGDEKTKKTSRVGYTTKPDGNKIRTLRQMKNKEVK
jgi:large subunit ribosomal protein L24